ncbi:Nucleolysin TIA-1 [Camponotus floridanus]|uniref:Nucleolysin TIA-1 n=1 Tax=Camponotus floridanus TaxID=104421 RepID=E2AB93_CAMFO|nr:Nucleolysin TIA-1 [Camponotus floridanus]
MRCSLISLIPSNFLSHFGNSSIKVGYAPGIREAHIYSNRVLALRLLTEHYHIFVGDLSPEIETHTLREAFSAFGEISVRPLVSQLDLGGEPKLAFRFKWWLRKSPNDAPRWFGGRHLKSGDWSPLPRAPTSGGFHPGSWCSVIVVIVAGRWRPNPPNEQRTRT